MGRYIKILLTAGAGLFLLLVPACEIGQWEKYPLESDVVFKIYESHEHSDSVAEPRIFIHMVTEKIYPHGGYVIKTETRIRREKIKLDIAGVWLRKDMLYPQVLSPARWLDTLELEEGEYELIFSYERFQDDYLLKVTDTTIEISQEDAIFTSPESSLAWRYRKNSFALGAARHANTYVDFIDSVKTRVDIREFSFPETGIKPNYGGYAPYIAYYTYEEDEDFEVVGGVLEDLTNSVLVDYPYTLIWVVNWKNKEYSSDDFRD